MKDLMQNPNQSQFELQRQAFKRLQDVPPEVEWFANIRNKHTKRVV